MIKDSTVTFVCAGVALCAYAVVIATFLSASCYHDPGILAPYGIAVGFFVNCCGALFGVLTIVRRTHGKWLGVVALGLNIALLAGMIVFMLTPIPCPAELVS